jgi:hypothetical protein
MYKNLGRQRSGKAAKYQKENQAFFIGAQDAGYRTPIPALFTWQYPVSVSCIRHPPSELIII